MTRPGPHTTTVRFSREVWTELKATCELDGVATAQYIREAIVARLARTEGNGLRDRVQALDSRVSRVENALRVLVEAAQRERRR